MDGEELLFDNKADPIQSKNLSASLAHKKRLVSMREKMNARMAELKDEFKSCTWYRDNWTDDRVVVKGAHGVFKRELGPTIAIDTTYSGVLK